MTNQALDLGTSTRLGKILAETASVMIWIADTSKGCVYFNASWLRFRGRTMEQEKGFGWAEGVHPDDFQRCLDVFTVAFDARQPFDMDYRLQCHDGSHRWIRDEGRPFFNEQGEFEGYIGSCTDIDEVYSVRERLELATEAGGIGVWQWDLARKDFIWDAQMCQLYGISCSLGNPSYDVWVQSLHPADRPAVEAELARVIADKGSSFKAEFRVLRGDGSIRHMIALAMISHDNAGEPKAMIGVSLDITEQRQAEHFLAESNAVLEQRVGERTVQLEQAKEVAEQANRAKGEFLANMSHELRTPLHGILGFAKLVGEDFSSLDPTGRLAKYCGRIVHNGEELLRLVDDLLDTAKIEDGSFRISRQIANLADQVREVVGEFADGSADAAAVVHDVPERLDASFDPHRLGQVLRNLIANARKFAPHDSTIEVSLRVDRDAHVATLTVADRGPGIPPSELESIFSRFIQGARTETGSGGTGLGLTIARGIMRQHGGDLSACNREGGGACFNATLPLEPEAFA